MTTTQSQGFDELVGAALEQGFSGWDFSYLHGRLELQEPSWSYPQRARVLLRDASAALDLGTGGGEILAALQPLPARTVATESFPPNVPVARRRLEPLGVEVVEIADERLPFDAGSFDVVLSRHEAFSAPDVQHVLTRGGRFLTQQVGGRNFAELNEVLGAPSSESSWGLDAAREELEQAGLELTDAREETLAARFQDIGAVVYYLRAAPWQIDGFSVDAFDRPLRSLHDRIRRDGGFELESHRFLLEARAA